MKLVLLALGLATVSFAAPREFLETDAVVPQDESMVQSSSRLSIESLQKQFHDLQMEVQDGATPGVYKTVKRMIDLINNTIESAIQDAHKSDQSELNTLMTTIGAYHVNIQKTIKIEQGAARDLDKVISKAHRLAEQWNQDSKAFTSTQNAYLQTYDEQTKSCCNKDKAGVVAIEYPPASAVCDYTDHATRETCSTTAIKDASGVVSDPFTKGLKKYRRLVKECNGLTAALATGNDDTEKDLGKCVLSKAEEGALVKQTTKDKVAWNSQWSKTTTAYSTKYDSLLKHFKKVTVRVKSDAVDRGHEFKAVNEIECLLKSYLEGGTFSAAAEKKCTVTENIVYKQKIKQPKVIAKLSWKRHKFAAFTDTKAWENTCDARKPDPAFTCSPPEPKPTKSCVPAEVKA